MPLNKRQIIELYRRRARWYNFTAQLYYLAGFREWAYRKRAVDALGLKPGDTVVELCCGTGLNFGLLERKLGPHGRIIGVDLTDAMLGRAEERIARNHWANVEIVRSDAAGVQFPPKVNGVISTFALTLVPEYEKVIRAGWEALAPGGRFVILDLKLPSNWLLRLMPVIIHTMRPFGVTLDLGSRHPWEALKKHFGNVSMAELYGGLAYIATAERKNVPALDKTEIFFEPQTRKRPSKPFRGVRRCRSSQSPHWRN